MNKFFSLFLTLLGLNVCTACSNHPNDVSAEEFKTLISNIETQIVDVRSAEEFREGHIKDALNIDVNDSTFTRKAIAMLDKKRPVGVYCRSGRRSAKAAEILTSEGYQVSNLAGGILEWKEKQMEVTTDSTEVDVFKTPGGKTVRFHALTHGSIRINYDGKEFEIDPVGKQGGRFVDYANQPKADFILVTHGHGDHFDMEAIQQLTRPGTCLIANLQCTNLAGHGLHMKNGDQLDFEEGITIEAVPAYNISEGNTQFHPQGRDNGYILTLDELRIYIAGDTEDIPEMEHINNIDIAFLPCNQPYTMTIEQLVRAARIIKPKVLFPYHYSQTDMSALPDLLKADGIEVRIRHYE